MADGGIGGLRLFQYTHFVSKTATDADGRARAAFPAVFPQG